MASANTHVVIAAHQVFHCSHSVTVHAHEVYALHKLVLQEVVPTREPERRSGVSHSVRRALHKQAQLFFKWLSGVLPRRRGPVTRRNADEPELPSNNYMTTSSPLPPLIDTVKEHCTRTTSGGVLDVTANMYSISMMLVRLVPAPPSCFAALASSSLPCCSRSTSLRKVVGPSSQQTRPQALFQMPGVSSPSPFGSNPKQAYWSQNVCSGILIPSK